MSKSKDSVKVQIPHSQLTTYSFSVSRFESGYFITKHTIVDNKVTSSVKVSEPDILSITMATLEKIIRKENGL